jgi:hypothetical protein
LALSENFDAVSSKQCSQKTQSKKKPIPLYSAIENLGLLTRRTGFNLRLSVQSDTRPVTNPGNPRSNHLLPSHCKTIHLLLCEAWWHGLDARHQPRSVQLAGVSFGVLQALLTLAVFVETSA